MLLLKKGMCVLRAALLGKLGMAASRIAGEAGNGSHTCPVILCNIESDRHSLSSSSSATGWLGDVLHNCEK